MKNIRKIFLTITILLTILILTNSFNIRGNLYMLFKGMPKQAMLTKIQNYSEVNTDNFIIRFDDTIGQSTVELVAETAEKHYEFLCSLYKYKPNDRPIIILYSDPEQLVDNANLAESKPPMGVYYASIISILTPDSWVPQGLDIRETFIQQGPIVHEVTHLLVDERTKGNCPLWFTEGLALYSEYITEGYEWGKDIELNDVYTISDLNDFKNQDPYLAYTESFRKVRFIVERYEFKIINDLLDALGKGEEFEEAYLNITRNDIIELNNIN